MGLFEEEDQKRRFVELSLNFFRTKLSAQTGWIHLFLEDPEAASQDSIPIVENFLYVYALFRSKMAAHVQEGKTLLEKILGFEVAGNFPVYLHEYPSCKDSNLSSHLLPPLFYLLRDFSVVLGESLTEKLRGLGERIVAHLQKTQLSFLSQGRLLAFLGRFESLYREPETPTEIAELFVLSQMMGKPIPEISWNSHLCVFTGKSKERFMQGFEPEVTLLDLFMAEGLKIHSLRAFKSNLAHIRACLIQPFDLEKGSSLPYEVLVDENHRQFFTLYYGDSSRVHSLTIEAKKGRFSFEKTEEGLFEVTYFYDEQMPSEEESMEFAVYVDSFQKIFIEKEKATAFQCEDALYIHSLFLDIKLSFLVDSQEGDWIGHISKGNRSFQKSKDLFSAYDWKIGLRTLRRKPQAKTKIRLFISLV